MSQDKTGEELYFLILDSLYIKKDKRKEFINDNINSEVKPRCDLCYRVKKLIQKEDNKYCTACLQLIRNENKKASNK